MLRVLIQPLRLLLALSGLVLLLGWFIDLRPLYLSAGVLLVVAAILMWFSGSARESESGGI